MSFTFEIYPRILGGAKICVTPEAGLRYVFKSISSIDPTLLRMAGELLRPGDVVWDVGANVGLFSAAASVKVGPTGEVIAIEADSWLVGLLRRSAALRNPLKQSAIEILPMAVADREGLVRFHIAARARSANHIEGLGSTQTGGMRLAVTVPSVRLDWLLNQRSAPDLVKIDVEGAELLVLRGSTKVLKSVRPIFLIEVGAECQAEVMSLFTSFSYNVYDADAPDWKERPLTHCPWNTLAIPSERRIGG